MRTSFQRLRLVFGVSAAVGALAAAAVPALAQQAVDDPSTRAAGADRSVPPPPIAIVPTRREDRIEYSPPPAVATDPTDLPAKPPGLSLVSEVRWMRAPKPDFPERALASGVTSSVVEANCLMHVNGALSDCLVLREEHPDLGFGQAAVVSLRRSRVSPRTVYEAAEGARAIVSVRFEIPIEPPVLAGSEMLIRDPVWDRSPVRQIGLVNPRYALPVTLIVSCEILPAGDIAGCRAEDASPAYSGLDRMVVLHAAKLSPDTVNRAAPGARVMFEVTFKTADPGGVFPTPVPVPDPARASPR